MAITKESIFLGALLLFPKSISDFCSETRRRYISEPKGQITRLSMEFLHYRDVVDTHVLSPIHIFSFVIPSNLTGKDQTPQFQLMDNLHAIRASSCTRDLRNCKAIHAYFITLVRLLYLFSGPVLLAKYFTAEFYFFCVLLATITLWRFALCSSAGPNTEHLSCSATYCISKKEGDLQVLFLIKKHINLFFNKSEVLIWI